MKPPEQTTVRHPRVESLTLRAHEQPRVPSVICEGWVLKKRRKRMQGFARRYFVLYSDGMLKYSFGPEKPVRDQLALQRAAISTTPGRKDIHVDSDMATFHIRCLTAEDFEAWMAAFRKFIRTETEHRRSASVRLATQQGFLPVNKIGTAIDEMAQTISELEESILAIVQEHQAKVHNKKLDKHKEGVLGLFKKEEVSNHYKSLLPASLESLPPSIQSATKALRTLKSQHESLLKSLQQVVRAESMYSLRGSPLPVTAEERSISSPIPSSSLRHSRPCSFTTVSDSLNEWYDAPDGPEEFVMQTDEQEHLDHTVSVDSCGHSMGDSGGDTDTEDHRTVQEGETPSITIQAVRRTELPASSSADEGSLFTILKNNVGKDLSTIAFPVTFNEPLTLLQRAAEEVEYYDLLDKAAISNDPIARICYVAAFAVSNYSHTRHRSGRKGFNPMLGETFEDVRMNFIAEKVRHNPVEIAYHAEGKGWELSAISCGKTKFWGKSLEIIPLGTTRVKIGKNHYVWKRPSSFIRNLIVGTKYLEHCGTMTIEDTLEQIRVVMEFKQNSYWGASNVVSGSVYGSNGKTVCELDGRWDEQFSQSIDSSQFRVLWRMNPFPTNTHQFYGFTSFAMTLNEITSNLVGKLPPTDSRYRPDVRALEEGDIDTAEEEKQRVEEQQRHRRRQGEDRRPRWFRQVGDEWEYTGEYWEMRAKGWKNEQIQSLW
ncbi:hypothetical protein M378DRAFT_65993 [Amanita muscaria Koide BX008]|uniref:PH domain-containing protein n=1 Tax=Amanita muscaria (strain Koide BX008) TaxID=946122 RepID=A0A0C2X8E1_AMAMK|nr:hypothetical protein M378DRAFT_65993 [Amanita muscaria Koide BX008]